MSSIFDKSGIKVTSTFDLQSNIPLDSRFVVDTLLNMNKYLDDLVGCAYLGMQVFCEENNTLYVLKGEAEDKATWHWEVAASRVVEAEIVEVEVDDEGYIVLNSENTDVNLNDQLESDAMNIDNQYLVD